jgi:hypothetical protein
MLKLFRVQLCIRHHQQFQQQACTLLAEYPARLLEHRSSSVALVAATKRTDWFVKLTSVALAFLRCCCCCCLPACFRCPFQVSELLPGGQSSIPALAEALLVVSRALDAEMGSMPSVEVSQTFDHWFVSFCPAGTLMLHPASSEQIVVVAVTILVNQEMRCVVWSECSSTLLYVTLRWASCPQWR